MKEFVLRSAVSNTGDEGEDGKSHASAPVGSKFYENVNNIAEMGQGLRHIDTAADPSNRPDGWIGHNLNGTRPRKTRNRAKPSHGDVGALKQVGASVRLRQRKAPTHTRRTSVTEIPAETANEGDRQYEKSREESGNAGDENQQQAQTTTPTTTRQKSPRWGIYGEAGPSDPPAIIGNPRPGRVGGFAFEPSSEFNIVLAVDTSPCPIHTLIATMGRQEWTSKGPRWEEELLPRGRENENDTMWLRRHHQLLNTEQSKRMSTDINSLRYLCQRAPKAPDFDGQARYLCLYTDAIRKLVHEVSGRISEFGRQITTVGTRTGRDARLVESAFECLRQSTIPLLVLTLREVLVLGLEAGAEGSELVRSNGRFTPSTISILIQITDWIAKLNGLAPGMPEQTPSIEPNTQAGKGTMHRFFANDSQRTLQRHMNQFRHILGQSMDKVALLTWEREALERDGLARIARGEKTVQHQAAQDLQMQLFIQSTKQTGEENPERLTPRLAVSQEQAPGWAGHRDWCYWEDYILLDMIRGVQEPNIHTLALSVPGRNVDEVGRRVSNLRNTMREKYEASDMIPPRWCYGGGMSRAD